MINYYTKIAPVFIICFMLLSACTPKGGYFSEMPVKIRELENKLKQYTDDEKAVKNNLDAFETFDFNIFNNQKWERMPESHAKDIIVNWPDGHSTKGIEKHIEGLKEMFVYSPKTKIKERRVKFATKEFTCVTGIMTGAFTKPLPVGNGTFIQPTGKKFSISMCTLGRWKNGVMIEKWLYWDTASYLKQIGVGN